MSTEPLEASSLDALASLCEAAFEFDAPARADLALSLFGISSGRGPSTEAGLEPPIVRGDPEVGVVASAVRGDGGYIRLIAVRPGHRRRGVAHVLLSAAEADLAAAGATSATVGADAPDFLFPGVDSRATPAHCLLEAHGYRRVGVNLNMEVDLERIPPDPGGAELGTPDERDDLAAWGAEHWPNWSHEILLALGRERLLVSRDEEGITGVCAWDVSRQGWLGPIAVRPGIIGKRSGVPLLLGCLHRMRGAGRKEAVIGWISPVRFYARNAGAVMGTAYVVYEKPLPAHPSVAAKALVTPDARL